MISKMPVDRSAETRTHRSATKRLFLTTLLCTGLAACGGSGDSESVSVEFTTVVQGSFSALNMSDQFMSRIVRTNSDWQVFWPSNFFVTPAPPAPVVDFGRLMVIALFLGGRPSACFEIAVREVRLSPMEVEVVYTEIGPDGQGCQAFVVAPFQFISIPTTSVPVRFRKI